MWTNKYDPVMTCQPLGVPREGPPRRIFQTDKDVVFIYFRRRRRRRIRRYRIIPTDGRKHDPRRRFEMTYLGYTVGRWEGDTLVLDSISFVDMTWLGRGGFFHSTEMRVVERFTRQGDVSCTTSRWKTLRSGGAVGVPDTNGAAQPESRRGPAESAATARCTKRRRLPTRFGARTPSLSNSFDTWFLTVLSLMPVPTAAGDPRRARGSSRRPGTTTRRPTGQIRIRQPT